MPREGEIGVGRATTADEHSDADDAVQQVARPARRWMLMRSRVRPRLRRQAIASRGPANIVLFGGL